MAQELHTIFYDCCAIGECRYAIHQPFRCGAYVAATDGAVLVRMKSDLELPPLPANRSVPNVNDMPWAREYPIVVPLPPPPALAWAECSQHCKRWVPVYEGIEVGPTAISTRYLRLLLVHQVREVQVAGPADPMRFTLGEIEGLVMPVSMCAVRTAGGTPR